MPVKLINLKKPLITYSLSIDTLYRFSSMDISLDIAVCSCTAFLSQSNKSNDTKSWLSKLIIPQLLQHFFQTLMFLQTPNLDQYTFLCSIFSDIIVLQYIHTFSAGLKTISLLKVSLRISIGISSGNILYSVK